MKVLFLNTFSEYGGAAIAAKRLENALKKEGVEVTHLSVFKKGIQLSQSAPSSSILTKPLSVLRFIWDRFRVSQIVRTSKWKYKYSDSTVGWSLVNHPLVKEADVLHLHWINFSFLTVEEIRRLSERKPIVWTMHDMWAFTGGCHYALECSEYLRACEQCFYLKKNRKDSKELLLKKQQQWLLSKIHWVACSQWLATTARSSHLLSGRSIRAIGNTLNFEVFKPIEVEEFKHKQGIPKGAFCMLVGAVDLQDERKGFKFLETLVEHLKDLDRLYILTFGSRHNLLSFKNGISFGQIESESEIVKIYSSADVFLQTSIQDNLPNTVMEAMACGTPVVGFDSGGIVDMVSNGVNGFIVPIGDTLKMAKSIRIIYEMSAEGRMKLANASREFVKTNFDENKISKAYLKEYQEALTTYQSGD